MLRLLLPFSGEVQLNIVEMCKGLIRSDGLVQELSLEINKEMKNEILHTVLESNGGERLDKSQEVNVMLSNNNESNLLKVNIDNDRTLSGYFNVLDYRDGAGIIGAIWLMGCLAFMGYQWMVYRSFRKQCARWSQICSDEMITKVFYEMCNEIGRAHV